MRKWIGIALALSGLLVFLGAQQLRAQAVANAQLSGIVTDPSGAAVPNAEVTATQTEEGLAQTTSTNSQGAYVFPNLPVGSYDLRVRHSGFDIYLQTGIHLEVSNKAVINVRLHLGSVTQLVNVRANANMVQTRNTSISQVIDTRRILDLPLNGRQATDLILLSSAATNSPPANANFMDDLVGSKNYFSATAISVAGGQADGTYYLLDGATNMDAYSDVNLPFPFPDALQEFSVQHGSLSARYGVLPGATVNVVTKSGTNDIHGDAFEFVRNGDFNARDFFAATQDTLKRNQFGGTIGGPLLRNKLFGFFGYQGTQIRTAPPNRIAFVPTSAVLNGDFSQLESAACQSNGQARTIVNPANGQPFANDFVSPSLFNQQALNLLKYVPLSNDPCGKLVYSIPNPQHENQFIGRVDWNQSAKQRLFGRYFFADYGSPASFNNNFLLTTLRGVRDRSQSMTIGDTYSITPTVLNSAHISWTRLAVTRGPASDFINLKDVGVNMVPGVPNFINLGIKGQFNIGCGSCAPTIIPNNSAQLADDVDLIRGRHHLYMGVDYIHRQKNDSGYSLANGIVAFNGQFSNDALVDFLLGRPNSFTQGNFRSEAPRQNYLGIYAGDNFRVTRRLNVQLGVRWEPHIAEYEKFDRMQHFDMAAYVAGTHSREFVNAPPGLLFPGDPGIPHAYANSSLGTGIEPRIGVTWDPTGSGRQVIRAGYGYFHEPLPLGFWTSFSGDAPWGNQITITNPVGGLTNPYLGYPGGDPFPLPNPPGPNQPFPAHAFYFNTPLNLAVTSVHMWNLGYQIQVAENWLLSATYIGNKTSHIMTAEDLNPAIYIPGMCGGAPCSTEQNIEGRRVLTGINPVAGALYSTIWNSDPGANAEYGGLLLSAQHRFAKYYTVVGNYTWSHCISEADFELDSFTQNPFDRNAERGNCGFDLRHNFNLSVVAEAPRFANPWSNRLFSNWQISTILTRHSGNWFSAYTGVDNSLTGEGFDRPNAVGNSYIRNIRTLQWLDPSAFPLNAIGTFGNSGSDSLVGPGYFNIDVGVSRFFKITERQKVELRFEFFNALNHPNFQTPDQIVTDATFGVIQSDYAPRILQFAMKYTF